MKQEGKVVFPGSFLATEEEFVTGKNAFDESGGIYSDSVGAGDKDMVQRVMNVKKLSRNILPLEVGASAIGIVEKTKERSVFIRITEAFRDSDKMIPATSLAQIPVSNIADFYVETTRDMFRIGDIVRAEVVEITPYRIVLGTKGSNFGVIKAFCSGCRAPMIRSGSELKCKKCGSTETRKVSSDYIG
jgi:exosome complex component CSL4